MSARRASTPEAAWFECDGCEATTVCSRGELHVAGWRLHSGTKAGGGMWKLLLCGACCAAGEPTQQHPVVRPT